MRHTLCGLLVAAALCGGPAPAQQAPADWHAYLDRIVDVLEENSVLRFEIDWPQFRSRVDAIAAPYNLAVDSERYEVLRQVLALLQDRCDAHSSYVPFASLELQRVAWSDGRIPHSPGEGLANPYDIDARVLDGGIGYIAIPRTFPDPIVGVPDAPLEMGLELLRLVRLLDEEPPAGWIIDLRGDRGGYLRTRWIGLHPFLAEGRLFGNAAPEPAGPPQLTSWTAFYGSLFTQTPVEGDGAQSSSIAADLGAQRYALRTPSAPIAVLVGRGTASAGEYAALALRQNPRVRLFGQATLGDTTAIDGFELEGGSLLLVASEYMVDPSGHVFASVTRAAWATGSLLSTGGCVAEPLRPDVLVAPPKPLTAAMQSRMTPDQIIAYRQADPTLDAAHAWLRDEIQAASSVGAGSSP